jgi:hypothetical protein
LECTFIGLAQEIGFSPTCFLSLLAEAGENRSKALNQPAREECNKCDLTAAPCF